MDNVMGLIRIKIADINNAKMLQILYIWIVNVIYF